MEFVPRCFKAHNIREGVYTYNYKIIFTIRHGTLLKLHVSLSTQVSAITEPQAVHKIEENAAQCM